MDRRSIMLMGALATLGACSQTATREASTGTATTVATATPAEEATGPARSCVGLQQIRESRVRSDRVIDFVMTGGATLRNRLPYRCPQLGFDRAFTYSTSISQLCSTDIITVINTAGGPTRGASCGLGQFVPISEATAKADVTG